MKALRTSLSALLILLLLGCGNGNSKAGDSSTPENNSENTTESTTSEPEEVDPMTLKGIGPVENVELGEVDQALAEEGKTIFKDKCTACHKPNKKYIGPAPAGILDRRTPEWVMNMILNPTEMIQKDPVGKKLLAEANGAVMANQNLTREQARAVLEYFRTIESE